MARFAWNKSGTFRSGTYSYTDAGGEQTVYEFINTKSKLLQGIFLDLFTMSQNGTIKVYYKIDGSTYREIITKTYTVGVDKVGVYVEANFAVSSSIKVTYTEESNEGAVRAVPYSIGYENRM